MFLSLWLPNVLLYIVTIKKNLTKQLVEREVCFGPWSRVQSILMGKSPKQELWQLLTLCLQERRVDECLCSVNSLYSRIPAQEMVLLISGWILSPQWTKSIQSLTVKSRSLSFRWFWNLPDWLSVKIHIPKIHKALYCCKPSTYR